MKELREAAVTSSKQVRHEVSQQQKLMTVVHGLNRILRMAGKSVACGASIYKARAIASNIAANLGQNPGFHRRPQGQAKSISPQFDAVSSESRGKSCDEVK